MQRTLYRVSKKLLIHIPPWIILVAVLVLVPVFIFMTIGILHRQKENTARLLVEKGAALIKCFEAAAGADTVDKHGQGLQVQRLLTQTAQQPDIVYLLITDIRGNILAHNDASKIGQTYETALDLSRIIHSQRVESRQVSGKEGMPIFEVFRRFSPLVAGHGRDAASALAREGKRSSILPEAAPQDAGQVIFVGLDMGPVEAARKEDARHMVVMAIVLFLIGFAGMVSLFLSQAYRSTRTSLSKVEAFSNNVVENMPVGLLVVGTDGRIASFNQVAESVLGISSSEVLGKAADNVLPQQILSAMQSVKSKGEIVEQEIDCPARQDKVIPLDVSATELRERRGTLMGYLILFRDVSEIRLLKKEVERSEHLASIGRLAAGIAHEIRNPLSSIKGFATYFRERYRDEPEDQEIADIMVQEVERLNRVIVQLLEFARPMHLQRKPTSLFLQVQHSLKMIESDMNRKAITAEIFGSPKIEKIWVDPDKITQVLLNLYLNALEAMEDGGTLSVEFGWDDHKRHILIIISDTGTGIKKEDLSHVFDPYFTTRSGGTGLGLAIVHNTIKAHGGEVRIVSHPGEGTRVIMSLPCVQAEQHL